MVTEFKNVPTLNWDEEEEENELHNQWATPWEIAGTCIVAVIVTFALWLFIWAINS